MYKKITHTIVEEHFDHPVDFEIAEGIKKTSMNMLRYYADGEQIVSGLPPSYCMATTEKKCGNCLAFDPTKNICKQWQLPVRTDYVCAAWTAVPA